MPVIDLFADIVCPWCYVGERRLAQALEKHGPEDVELRWRPFQLNPDMPSDGLAWSAFEEWKFGGQSSAQQAYARLEEAAAETEIDFHFDRITHAPNTLHAHRLVLWAQEQGESEAVASRLFKAYFSEGRNVGDQSVLVAVAGEAGLDEEAARAFLEGEEGREAVSVSQEIARQSGITGVPLTLFEDAFALRGAQPQRVFDDAVQRWVTERAAG